MSKLVDDFVCLDHAEGQVWEEPQVWEMENKPESQVKMPEQ